MSLTTIDKTKVAEFTPTVIAQEAINYLRNYAIMPRFVSKDVGTEFRTKGEVLSIPKYGNVTVRDKTANTDISLDQPDDDKVQLTLNKHKYVAFALEDVAQALSGSDIILPGYAKQGLERIGDQIDADILALVPSITAQVGSAGTDVSPNVITNAWKALIDAKSPRGARKYFVMASKDGENLLQQEKFTSAAWLADEGEAIKEAALGRKYGFDLFVDTQVPTSGSSPVSTHNIAFLEDAFVLAMRPLPMPAGGIIAADTVVDPETGMAARVVYSWDHKAMATICTIDVLYGVAIKRNELAVEVLS